MILGALTLFFIHARARREQPVVAVYGEDGTGRGIYARRERLERAR